MFSWTGSVIVKYNSYKNREISEPKTWATKVWKATKMSDFVNTYSIWLMCYIITSGVRPEQGCVTGWGWGLVVHRAAGHIRAFKQLNSHSVVSRKVWMIWTTIKTPRSPIRRSTSTSQNIHPLQGENKLAHSVGASLNQTLSVITGEVAVRRALACCQLAPHHTTDSYVMQWWKKGEGCALRSIYCYVYYAVVLRGKINNGTLWNLVSAREQTWADHRE